MLFRSAIVKGENVPEPGVPESFKVLIKELQSLGLDVRVLTEEAQEIQIKDEEEDVREMARELGLDIEGRPEPSEIVEETGEEPEVFEGSEEGEEQLLVEEEIPPVEVAEEE